MEILLGYLIKYIAAGPLVGCARKEDINFFCSQQKAQSRVMYTSRFEAALKAASGFPVSLLSPYPPVGRVVMPRAEAVVGRFVVGLEAHHKSPLYIEDGAEAYQTI